jgi:hypothetical protein
MTPFTMRLAFGTDLFRFLPNLSVVCLAVISLDSCEELSRPQVTEESVQSWPLSAGAIVRVESSCGAILVAGWDREECKLEVVKRAGDSAQLALMTVEADTNEARLKVRATAPPGTGSDPNQGPRVDIRLWVPRDAVLESIVTGRGDITISDTDGGVVATSVNGSVLVERATGNLSLKCVNGRTVARLSALRPGSRLELETINGSTSVSLPMGASVDVSAHAANGSVMSDLGLPIEADFPAGRKMVGRLGAGGVTVSARTINGSVSVWKGH